MRRKMMSAWLLSVALAACGGGGEEPAAQDPLDIPPAATPEAAMSSVPAMSSASDLEQVCGGGTVAAATSYEKGSKGPHRLIAFSGEAPEYEELTLDFPEGWAIDFLAYEQAELVACLDRVDERFVKTCEGYSSEESDEEFSVDLYDATYAVSLIAATSGEILAEGEIESSDKECPYIAFFDEGEKKQRQDADPSKQLREFVKDYVVP